MYLVWYFKSFTEEEQTRFVFNHNVIYIKYKYYIKLYIHALILLYLL